MGDVSELLGHWGYFAIFFFVVAGNMGLPFPEETILVLAGYMVWRGELELRIVLLVGIVSAAAGDNLGYWLGRRYGRDALRRHAQWILGNADRLETMQAFVARHGPFGVFVARFVPGLRFMAGPLAGVLGLGFLSFLLANLLGAITYVPLAVGAGYAVGYGFGEYVERARRVAGDVEFVVIGVVLVVGFGFVGWRAIRSRWRRGKS